MTQKSKRILAFIGTLILLIASNICTGVLVQKRANADYEGLKARIKATIERNQAMEEELEAFQAAYPDFVYEK
jgi:cell division protein FtsB